MHYLKQLLAIVRSNPLYVYMLFALILAFVLVVGAVVSTL